MTDPDPPVEPPEEPPDPETEPIPVILAGLEEYLHAEIGRHR
jgi:hypothetical protein